MKNLLNLASIAAIIFLSSCSEEEDGITVNLADFDPIAERYPFEDLTPSMEVNYWELVESQGFPDYNTVLSSGTKCLDMNTTQCSNTYDLVYQTNTGFDPECLPDYCYKYLIYESQQTVNVANDEPGVVDFVKPIGSFSDALLVVMAHGYSFSTTNKSIGAIRKADVGYEILATKLVGYCAPIQTNRFLLQVTGSGELNILQEEVYSRDEGSCI